MTTPSREAMSSPENFRKFMEKARLGLTPEQVEQIINSDNAFRHSPHNPFNRTTPGLGAPPDETSTTRKFVGKLLALLRRRH